MHFTRLRRTFWQAYRQGQFSVGKGVEYLYILTIVAAFLVVTSVLEAFNKTEGVLRQIAAAARWALPPGSRSLALSFLQSNQHHATRIIFSASMVTLLAASGVMISWMEGFRRAYGMLNTTSFWKERAVAVYLPRPGLVPMGFA